MATYAQLDLTVWRNDDTWEFPLRIIGPNLTGIDMRAQIRSSADAPGPPKADLALVTNGNAEGVRLAGVVQLPDGTWSNDVRIRLNKSTRQSFPYEGEVGNTAVLAWGFLLAGVTRAQGKVFLPAQVFGSDNAPAKRSTSFGARSSAGSASAGATLTIGQDGGATLTIDGADLLGTLVTQAAVIRDSVRPLIGFGAPAADLGIVGSTYRQAESLDLEWVKTEAGWQGPRSLKGSTGAPGSVSSASGLAVETPVAGTTAGVDIAHYAGQGGTSPNAVSVHDYTNAPRSLQLDKVGGTIASAHFVLGLRRANNSIRRPDLPGTYVSQAGFLRCSYDSFTQVPVFTGSISGNFLTVTDVTSGAVAPGHFLKWGSEDNGTTIVAQVNGAAGGPGTYTVARRGVTAVGQTVAEQAMTGFVKSEVLAFYIGREGDFGWSTDRVQMLTGYSGGLYAYTFKASAATMYIASFESASGQVLNVVDAIGGTRTDLIAPANQTSGMRLEAAGGGIDLAPKAGAAVTVRGPLNSPSGSDLTITAVGARLNLNGSTGVASLAPFILPIYTVGTLPAAGAFNGATVRVSNGDAGAPCLATSDGTSWKRVPLGAAVAVS